MEARCCTDRANIGVWTHEWSSVIRNVAKGAEWTTRKVRSKRASVGKLGVEFGQKIREGKVNHVDDLFTNLKYELVITGFCYALQQQKKKKDNEAGGTKK
jgi:hypothetical protein